MKKLLLLITLFVGVISFAQKSDNDKILELSKKIQESEDKDEKEKALLEMKDIVENSSEPITRLMGKKLYSAALEFHNTKISQVDCNSFDSLSKEEKKGFYIDTDKFRNISFIKPTNMGFDTRIKPYIVSQEGKCNLRIKFVYESSASNWLFMDKVIALVDEKKYEIPVEPDRDISISSGTVENADLFITEDLYHIIKEISESKKTDLRYSGKNHYDFVVPQKTKDKLKATLLLFDKLKK